MYFRPPTEEEILRGIGDVKELSDPLRQALMPSSDFEPIPVPQSGDWLAVHPESGQTFGEFAGTLPFKPKVPRKIIYLQPLGKFSDNGSPSLDALRTFATAFFATEVRIRPSIVIEKANIENRINRLSGRRQLLTRDILILLGRDLPRDAFCILAITTEDLYPDRSWNFVFGEALPVGRTGVFSFARYDPHFYGQSRKGNRQRILLWRSCKVLAHEMAHMFFLSHCIFFRCLMNGANHLAESDSRPLHLCPVCLRKLQHSIGFDVVERYRELRKFYGQVKFSDEEGWTASRLRRIHDEEKEL